MGIGQLRCHVININDLPVAEAFWSELTGLPVIPSVFPSEYSYLGQADPWRHDVILHLVRTPKGAGGRTVHTSTSGSATSTARSSRSRPSADGSSEVRPSIRDPAPTRERTHHRLGGRPGSLRQRVLHHPTTQPGRTRRRYPQAGRQGHGDDPHWRMVAGNAPTAT